MVSEQRVYSRRDYERNPLEVYISYGGVGIGPHATTTRQTYTVPAGRKAILKAGCLSMVRSTAAAPVVAFRIVLGIGGSFTLNVNSLNNTPGVPDRVFGGFGALWLAGDIIVLQTVDGSTGGTVDYFVNSNTVEFDS